MKKPPDKSVFGIGEKKKKPSSPPSFKSASAGPADEPDGPDDEQAEAADPLAALSKDAGGPPDAAGGADPGLDPLGGPSSASDAGPSDLTPEMMNYHGGDTTCGSCMHMVGETQCDRWPDPIDAGGWCLGYQSGGEAEAGGGPGQMAGLMGGGPGMPPGGGGPPMGGMGQ